jgi:sec-independent protein translocase protein TatB
MSGVGFWELVLLFLIGLIVLGPERLPRVANQLGTWVGQARRMTRVLKRQLEDELNLEKELNIRPRPPVRSLPPKPAKEVDDAYSPAHDAGSPGTGAGAADSDGGNDFVDTDVLDEAVENGAATTAEVAAPDRNSAAKSNT